MITRAIRQLKHSATPTDQVRRAGAGRKKMRDRAPAILADLEALVEPDSRGDPMPPLRWTRKSTRQLADALTRRGHSVSHTLVARLPVEA